MNTSPTLAFELRQKRGFKADAERVAHEVRRHLNIATHEPLDPRTLAGLLAIDVWTLDELSIPSEVREELHGPAARRWSAILVHIEEPGGRDVIIHNATHDPHRQNSNIFHEIAHRLCGHKADGVWDFGGMPVRDYRPDDERQAEYLGYALHLPKDALFWALRQGMTDHEVSDRFEASTELVRHRFNLTSAKRIFRR